MSAATAVSVEEYLATSYEFDPEYVGGELVERPMPNLPHGLVAANLTAAFHGAPQMYAAPQVRLRINPEHYRVPDLMIFADALPSGQYPLVAPFAILEILSPGDALSELLDKFEDYASLGVGQIWLIDPEHRRIARYENGSLLRQAALELRDVKMTTEEIFG